MFKRNYKTIYLHRYIMDMHDKNPRLKVDHLNGNTMDNRKENLRVCTQKQNSANRRHKGYSFDKESGKYKANIRVNGVLKNLGRYDTPEEAREVYKNAHAKVFKEFSPYHKEEN